MTGDTENPTERPFQSLRAAWISIGVVAFLMVFRPFGLSLDSVAEVLVVAGLAPVNYLVMRGLHRVPLPDEPWRGVLGFATLVVVNTVYLAVWAEDGAPVRTVVAVALVTGLAIMFVALWNRGRIPEQELSEQATPSREQALITLTGESGQEILRLETNELLYLSANGNYVDVHYRRGDTVAKSMLRCSLTGLSDQVPGNILTRCHRSHMVNLLVARRVVRSRGRTFIEFDGGGRVPISRSYRQGVLESLSG